MSDDTMIDVMGETADVALESYTKEEPGVHPFRISTVEWKKWPADADKGQDIGSINLNVKLTYANGPYEGREKYVNITWAKARRKLADGTTEIVPSEMAVSGWMADGLSNDEAVAKAIAGSTLSETIGKQTFTKLQNAAGFIRAKDVNQSNTAEVEGRVNLGEARVMEADGTFTDGSGKFDLSMLEGRIVMGKTKLGKKKVHKTTGQEVQYVEVYSFDWPNPAKYGQLEGTSPF